ncbi:MAG: peptidyl-prolyl cis-trans isomerase [Candidatus Latescibacterota bacterium]|nr:MAG: peptidyl-prolyl cis-trans isomerase [Candidatus Latescibacterota bacterium]
MRHLFLWTGALLIVALGTASAQQAGSAQASEKESGAVNPVVLMKTSMGDIQIELFADKAPVTVRNFLSYVDDKFYDGTIFHRVIETFVIQGGGFTKDLKRKETKAAIKNEADNGLSNSRGTVAMARLPEKDTATSQFFINVADNASLDHFDNAQRFGYCVFGKVIAGMDVVDKIKSVETGAKGQLPKDVPLETVEIVSVTRADK